MLSVRNQTFYPVVLGITGEITIVVKHWALTTCSWSVQCYRNVVTNTTQLTHWILSLRKHTSASGGVNKVPWAVVGLAHLIQEAHQCAKAQCKDALNLIRVVAHLKWGGDRDTLLMLYRAIVHSKLDYGCIVYASASNTDLRQLDSIHNSGLRLALGAFCTSPVSSLYTEANKAPLEKRRLKLSM